MLRKVFCLIAVLLILPTFAANAATELSSFSVFATNSVWIRQGADINSGNIGVKDVSPGPWLASQSEVTVGINVYVADGVSIYGDSIKVKTGASAFDVYYNKLTNNGTIRGSENTPLSLPLDIMMPPFPTPVPGTEDHDILQGGSLTLSPGSYGETMVRKNATLTLTGGTYHFENLDLGILNAKVLFQAPTDMIINNRLKPGKDAFIGPEDGSGISAKDIRIYVCGINGSTGNLGATPKAARIGFNNTLHANIYAPFGTLWIKKGTIAEGSFIGRDVKIGANIQLSLNSGFGDPDLDGDGFTESQGDCNDNDATINPAAQEVCDSVDNNCDGQIDEGVINPYYEDTDSDGYGNPNISTDSCQQPSGYVADNTDCDDSDASVNPATTEIPYNGKDDDCNSATPDDDLDGDGFISVNDCNDNDSGIFPGAAETPYDGIDQDCDGNDLNDLDFDGYIATQAGGNDCDDDNSAVNPGATEITGNGIDDDCNPGTTDSVVDIPEGTYGDQYENLVPPDATITSYDDNRFALITGSVQDSFLNPVPAIVVSIHGYPEYGTVQTNSEGEFSIPVEGGGTITVVYEKSGFITSHRNVYVPWNDIAIAETVTMISEDTASTTLTFDGNPSTIITHSSSPVTDEFGDRSLTMVFHGDNQAFSVDEFGNETELTTITTRATEFETLESMPAKLPPNSAYTYCSELSVDGAVKVRFEKPVIVYIDNFLGFDRGGAVPVGYYDRDRAVWVPLDNGVVVKLLDTDSDGIVDALDSTGDDQPDDLNSDGFFNDEVYGLDNPVQYSPGSTYWYFEAWHFTPYDWNWSFGPPADVIQPNPEGVLVVDQDSDKNDDPCDNDYTSSYVERRSRIFHEDVPIPGTDFTLHYASNRVSGYKSVISIPVSGANLPASLKKIKVTMRIAGQVFEQTLDSLPDQKVEFTWDGLDYLGNTVAGSIKADVSIGFVYDAVYLSPGNFTQSFAQAGTNVTTIRARQEIITWKKYTERIYRSDRKTGKIAEGWTLSAHHFWRPYHPGTLYKGDGTTSNNDVTIITTVAGNGQNGYSGDGGPATEAKLDFPFSIDVDSAGNIYTSDTNNSVIRKVDTNGIITTVAGNGDGGSGSTGDGGPATEATIWGAATGVAVDSIGNIYIAEIHAHRIRKVDTNGIITTVAGNGQWSYSGDGGPATQAAIARPQGVAVDSMGNIYIADDGNYRVRKVDTNGIITTVAGNGQFGYSGDGGLATEAELTGLEDIYVDSTGNIYIPYSGNHSIRKVDTGGIITTVAGIGQFGYSGDGGPATEAMFRSPIDMTVDSIGNIYIADHENNRVRKVDTSGIITTVIGNGQWSYSGDGGPSTEAEISRAGGIAVDSIGDYYISDTYNHRIRKVSFPDVFAGLITVGEMAFTDENGLGYIMDSTGLHKSTIDLSTGNTLLSFGYDGDSQLESLTDQFGNQTTIQRDASGVPISITSPDGIMTGLTVDGNSHLTQVTSPDNTSFSFTYDLGGLMTDEYDLKGNHFVHIYDGSGKVTDINDPEGGTWDYSRTVDSDGNVTTTAQTGEGNTTTYVDRTETTGASTSVKTGSDGSISTISRASDGITETNELSCGMTLDMKYDLDSEYIYRYLKDVTRTSPSGLLRSTTSSKSYADTNTDGIPDLITDTVTVNGKDWTSADNTLTGMITNTSPLGRVSTVKYNTTNLLTDESEVTGILPLTFSYDTRGRLIGTTVGTRTSTRDYDANGYLDYIITPDNKTYDYTFDVMGRLTREDRPDNTSIGYSYDNNGNMTLLVTPKSISHTFDYTGNDQRKDYTPPISGSYAYVFDKERKLKTLTFPTGSQIQNTYTNGLLTNTLTPENTIDFTYECTSLLSGASMGSETVAYAYDGSLLETDTRSGILNKAINYTYDNNHRLASVTYAGSNYLLGYDDDSLLTSVGGFTITRNTDNGLPESVSDGTLTQTRSFNGYGEVDNYSNTVNAVNAYDVSLTRDNSGRITERIEVIGAETITWDYVYDDLGRLEEVKKNTNVVESYEYDANGNRTLETNTAKGITNKVYDYSNEDHIISAGTDLYVFDYDGFLVDKVSEAGATTHDYSLRGELLSVDLTDGRSITYDHDPMGRRVAKKIDGTVVEKYLWRDNTTLLAVYDGLDNLTMRFNYADGRLPISMLRGGNTYYMMYDQVGSLKLIVDSTGSTTKRIDYDSFGNIINDTNPGFTLPFGFAGGLHDRDTGLVRFGARDFDPTIGRWTAKDPIDFAGGDTNLYGYVANNPVNFIDPNGEFINGITAGIGASIGAAVGATNAIFNGGSIWKGAAFGALTGATAGFTFGASIYVHAAAHAAISAGTDVLQQTFTTPCGHINYGSVVSSGIAGALGGGLGKFLVRKGEAAVVDAAILSGGLSGIVNAGLTWATQPVNR